MEAQRLIRIFGEQGERPSFVGWLDRFLHEVDLNEAQRQHDAFCATLTALGVDVAELGSDGPTGDAVYTFDPMLVTDAGAVPLRPGKPNRRGEELILAFEPELTAAWGDVARRPVTWPMVMRAGEIR